MHLLALLLKLTNLSALLCILNSDNVYQLYDVARKLLYTITVHITTTIMMVKSASNWAIYGKKLLIKLILIKTSVGRLKHTLKYVQLLLLWNILLIFHYQPDATLYWLIMLIITLALIDLLWHIATTGSGDTTTAADVPTATDSQTQTCMYMFCICN